jgi:hypothetical protein
VPPGFDVEPIFEAAAIAESTGDWLQLDDERALVAAGERAKDDRERESDENDQKQAHCHLPMQGHERRVLLRQLRHASCTTDCDRSQKRRSGGGPNAANGATDRGTLTRVPA